MPRSSASDNDVMEATLDNDVMEATLDNDVMEATLTGRRTMIRGPTDAAKEGIEDEEAEGSEKEEGIEEKDEDEEEEEGTGAVGNDEEGLARTPSPAT